MIPNVLRGIGRRIRGTLERAWREPGAERLIEVQELLSVGTCPLCLEGGHTVEMSPPMAIEGSHSAAFVITCTDTGSEEIVYV